MPDPSLFRRKTIGVRVTEDDYARLQVLADAQSKTIGEWCRETILACANRHVTTGQRSITTEMHALMAEVVSLRTIVLNVLFRQANDETLTAEQMQELIQRADADKLKKALERLQHAAKAAGG
jgi:hypothetical protein